VQTLNQAFGIPPTTNRKFETRKKHNRLRPKVVYRIVQLHTIENMAIDGELFAKVGRELGTSASTVSRLYYDKEGKLLRKILTNATLW